MIVRVCNLKDQLGTRGPRPMLYCTVQGCEYSAHAGDYFMARPDHVFRCHGRNMILAVKRTVIEPVTV